MEEPSKFLMESVWSWATKATISHQYPAQSHQPSFHQSQPNFQSNYQHNFQPTYQQQQQNHSDKKLSDLERMIETLSKTQALMMNNHNQAIIG